MSYLRIALVTLAITMVGGCGGSGGDGDGAPPGGGKVDSAPTISSLIYNPSAIYVNDGGGQMQIAGTVDFSDPDGDLNTATLSILDEQAQIIDTEIVTVAGAAGIQTGTLGGSIMISTTETGHFTFEVFVTDKSGRQSNKLAGGLSITQFPWVSRTAMPTQRAAFSTAVIGELIYVIGGNDVNYPGTPKPPVTTVEIYNTATDSWTTGTPLPQAVSSSITAAVNGKLYVIGGKPDVFIETRDVHEYDPATDSWASKTAMPESVLGAASAVISNQIHVAGGSGPGTTLNTLYVFDPEQNTWTTRTPMTNARSTPSGSAVNGKLVVYGGYGSTLVTDGGYFRAIDTYDPLLDTWTLGANGEPRRSSAVAAVDTTMYVFGGNYVGIFFDTSRAYDSVTDEWSIRTTMPGVVRFPRAEVVNERIYIFGEQSTYEYTPANDAL